VIQLDDLQQIGRELRRHEPLVRRHEPLERFEQSFSCDEEPALLGDAGLLACGGRSRERGRRHRFEWIPQPPDHPTPSKSGVALRFPPQSMASLRLREPPQNLAAQFAKSLWSRACGSMTGASNSVAPRLRDGDPMPAGAGHAFPFQPLPITMTHLVLSTGGTAGGCGSIAQRPHSLSFPVYG